MQVQRSSLLTEFIPPKASQSLDRMEEDSDLDGAGPSEVVPKKEVTGMYFFTPPPNPQPHHHHHFAQPNPVFSNKTTESSRG